MEMQMKQIINHNKDNGLLNMIGRTDPMIIYLNYEKSAQHSDFKDIGLTYYELIGHELKHAYDIEFYKNNLPKDKNDIRPTEYYAVNFENLIRKEEGNKLREKYTIPIPKEYKNKIELWK